MDVEGVENKIGRVEYKKVNKSADKKIMGDINVHCWRANG
jgi:hypothetical protein